MFILIYFDCQLTDTILYHCNYSFSIVCQRAVYIVYMLTNRHMLYPVSSGCTRPALHPLEYNNIKVSHSIMSNNSSILLQ